MLNGLIAFAALAGVAIVLRKRLPPAWAHALGAIVFWFFAGLAALFAAIAVWTASGISSGQGFWLVFAAVQIGGATLVFLIGRFLQRLLVA